MGTFERKLISGSDVTGINVTLSQKHLWEGQVREEQGSPKLLFEDQAFQLYPGFRQTEPSSQKKTVANLSCNWKLFFRGLLLSFPGTVLIRILRSWEFSVGTQPWRQHTAPPTKSCSNFTATFQMAVSSSSIFTVSVFSLHWWWQRILADFSHRVDINFVYS